MCPCSTQLYSILKKEQHSIRMHSIKGSVHCVVHSPVQGPGFTLSLWFMCVSVCVSTPEGINNQWHDIDHV